MIVFDDQDALDAYVRRVLAAYLTMCDGAVEQAILRTAAERDIPPAAVTLVQGGAKVTQALYRGSLHLPLPTVAR